MTTTQVNLHQLLRMMVERGASVLHITTGAPPQLRIDGRLVSVKMPPLTPVDTKRLCYSILTEAQKGRFETENELDLSFGIKGLARFRSNIFVQRGAVAGAFRAIPFRIMSFAELGLPPMLSDLTARTDGLVLVTGPTGSGKSTTLAAMVDKISSERSCHIITIEDPIEYVYSHKNSIVNQREVGGDTESFGGALRYVLRQDPDVVMIGEIRDLESLEATMRIAETGHLVLTTMHTNSAIQSINRIIDMFPPHQQMQARVQLSFILVAVLSQRLLPRASGVGRILATEILLPNAAIRSLIREDKAHQIYGQMQMGQGKHGMQTMNQALAVLLQQNIVSEHDAYVNSPDPEELSKMVKSSR